MIVPMKKISIFVQSKDTVSSTKRLRSLGVLHIEHQRTPKGKDVESIRDDTALIDRTLNILSSEEFSKTPVSEPKEKIVDWKFSAKHIINSWKRLDQVNEYAKGLEDLMKTWKQWGEFDPESINALAKRNIFIKLYNIPARDMKRPPSGLIVKKLFTSRGVTHCAIISDKEIDLPFGELALPKLSTKEASRRLEESRNVAEWIKEDIRRHICYRPIFTRLKRSMEKDLEFNQALRGIGQAGEIAYLRGYIPFDVAETLLEVSKKEKWGVVINDPSDEDRVPTLVRNPRWVSIIEPVFKMLEIVPGYQELDISLWFLVFFSIFFGMLIGDAGYGAIFFTLTLFAHKKVGNKLQSKSVFILFYLLSSFTILWGVLTGTFFGQEWLPQSVRPLIPVLRESRNIQSLCFLLGAIHLSIAHLWRGILKLPSFKALADIGWMLILWGAFFLAKMLILGDIFPRFALWLFAAGAGLVILFTNPMRNILKGIGAGFGNLLLNFVNSFTDIVSYIRLFAVGLATVAIADAFNKMAMDIGYNSVLTGIVTSLILILGHALNIILGSLAIIVHGVRLNVLEFCSHLDIKWSGFSYNPLKE
jgi:V/A-type H+-transporting ATPase subunit I